MCDLQWERRGDPIPADPKLLQRHVGATDEEWAAAWSVLESKFPPTDEGDGRRNPKMHAIWLEAVERAEKRTKAGRSGGVASGRARKRKKEQQLRTTVERPLNDGRTKTNKKRREEKREEEDTPPNPPTGGPVCEPPEGGPVDDVEAGAQLVVARWRDRVNQCGADMRGVSMVRARFMDGYSTDQLVRAVDRHAADVAARPPDHRDRFTLGAFFGPTGPWREAMTDTGPLPPTYEDAQAARERKAREPTDPEVRKAFGYDD